MVTTRPSALSPRVVCTTLDTFSPVSMRHLGFASQAAPLSTQ
jgi:hypothetical protein